MIKFIPLFHFNIYIYMVLINATQTKLKEGDAEVSPIKRITIKQQRND